ncbi:MAG: SIS domain-containing protein, partial [Dehalococcoidia bacterium]
YLVPPQDPDALAERIAHLYQNPKLLAIFRQQAIGRVNAIFTWSHVTNGVSGVYERVIDGVRPGQGHETRQLSIIDRGFAEASEVLDRSRRRLRNSIREAAELLSDCFARGGKVLICGNGGSAADAQHFTGELVGRFRSNERAGLPAIALSADTAVLTAWSNDVGYEHAFARQVEALGRGRDMLLGISTSGRAPTDS